jgi:hypothetical protein
MRRGAGDELAAGCAKSEMFHAASQATMYNLDSNLCSVCYSFLRLNKWNL